MAPAVLLLICRYLASGSATRQLFPEVRRRRLPLRHLHRVSSSRVCHHAASSDSAESRGPDILTNCIQPMGCCGSSTVDAEEHLDYSAGKVTIIPDLKSWERKLDEASELGQTVVVKFSATWCGPCRNAAPVFAELSLKHSDLVFVSVDVDDLPELVTQFDVRATPTFVFMRDKQEIDKLVGGNQEDLIKKFDPYCQQN